jgi:hypothetical protein
MSKVLTDNEQALYLELISAQDDNNFLRESLAVAEADIKELRSVLSSDNLMFGNALAEMEQEYGILLREKEQLENELSELRERCE